MTVTPHVKQHLLPRAETMQLKSIPLFTECNTY